MALDEGTEKQLARVRAEIEEALGQALVCLALYGSAAGDDWVAGRSDLNLAIVVPRVSVQVLETLAPLVARWRRRGFALPLVLDPEYLERARDAFPMELEDIRREHRVLAGRDVFAAVRTDPAAMRRECEREGRGKLLRLRALFLETAGAPRALEGVLVGSLKSFLTLLRHLLGLRGESPGHGYGEVLRAGEALVGPLPVMRRLLAHRSGLAKLSRRALRDEFGAYLEEVERIVAALDAADA